MKINNFIDENDVKNKELYQSTFNEIHASSELLREVKDMNKDNIKKGFKWTRRFGYGLAALAAVGFISSNAIVYAATGTTWVKKAFVTIDGEKKEVKVEKTVDENGNKAISFEFDVDEEKDANQSFKIDGDADINPEDLDGMEINSDNVKTELKEEDGKVYLVVEDEQKIDVTEDIKDEVCDGIFEKEGQKYSYKIKGNINEYNIIINAE